MKYMIDKNNVWTVYFHTNLREIKIEKIKEDKHISHVKYMIDENNCWPVRDFLIYIQIFTKN